MKIRVLGAAAGGGFPQWNCNARLSRAVRERCSGLLPRTQSSLAVSADGRRWVLLNASPDLRRQIAEAPALQPDPHGPLRNSPIAAVVLTNGDVDHIAGLLNLRERQPFHLYASRRVLDILADNSIFDVLAPDIVRRLELPLSGTVALAGPEGPLGLRLESFVVPGKVALYREDRSAATANFGTVAGDTIGVKIRAGGCDGTLCYIPGCAGVDDALKARLTGVDCLLFDGTVFTDDEMRQAGVGDKTGARMGHMSISGPGGSLEALADVPISRRIYVHINTTNPILEPGSVAERRVADAGWEVAADGMEIDL